MGDQLTLTIPEGLNHRPAPVSHMRYHSLDASCSAVTDELNTASSLKMRALTIKKYLRHVVEYCPSRALHLIALRLFSFCLQICTPHRETDGDVYKLIFIPKGALLFWNARQALKL